VNTDKKQRIHHHVNERKAKKKFENISCSSSQWYCLSRVNYKSD